MEPTLQNGNALLLKKWGVPQKGDIVTAYIDELDYTVEHYSTEYLRRLMKTKKKPVLSRQKGGYLKR